MPLTHARQDLLTGVSKWTTCLVAWTPASVRPAQTTLISLDATSHNPRSRDCCTVAVSAPWVCQPWKAMPQYSTISATRSVNLPEQFARFPSFRLTAFLHDLLKDIARTVTITHVDIGPRKVELVVGVVVQIMLQRAGILEI